MDKHNTSVADLMYLCEVYRVARRGNVLWILALSLYRRCQYLKTGEREENVVWDKG